MTTSVGMCNIINQLRQGILQNWTHVSVKATTLSAAIVPWLVKERIIQSYSKNVAQTRLCLVLIKNNGHSVFKTVNLVSRPGWYKPITVFQLKSYLYKYKTAIVVINTNKGLMTGKDALHNNVGGEILFILEVA